MKILLITPTDLDSTSGGGIRSSHLRDGLAELGSVDTIIVRQGEDGWDESDWDADRVMKIAKRRFSVLASFSEVIRLRRHIGQIIKRENYDFIVARYLSTSLLVPCHAWSRLVIDADDAIKEVPPADRSVLRRLQMSLRNVAVDRIIRRVLHIWYVNPFDEPRLKVRHKSLLRNVVQVPPPARQPRRPVPGRILMVGMFWYAPNHEGLRWFVQNVLPSLIAENPEVELHAVGNSGDALGLVGPGVKLRGYVDDLAAEYEQASLVIAPIQSGGGTQIKVIEALAHGRPVVASEFAYRGFSRDFRETEHLLVGRDADDWISKCRSVLTDPETAEAMAGRATTSMTPYTPARMASAVRATLETLARA